MTATVCTLCRRPKSTASDLYGEPGLCRAECVWRTGNPLADLLDCRSIALSIAALVAPVVEAAERWVSGSIALDRFNEEAIQVAVYDMRDGLRRLGGS